MSEQQQIEAWIALQPERRRADLAWLHGRITAMAPGCRLWFVSGRNDAGKTVSNPSAGYGSHTRRYADGEVREFYRVGISGNTTGVSVYLMGIDDRTFLPRTYGPKLGKAKVTGYCIAFRSLQDVDIPVLEAAIALHLDGRLGAGDP